MKSTKTPKLYSVVVQLPRDKQEKLHNEQARRKLAGRTQTLVDVASELLGQKLDEA